MRIVLALSLIAFLLCAGSALAQNPAPAAPIRVAVVTGGHDFDEKTFPGVFEGNPDIAYTIVPQKDQSEIFENIDNWSYDVIVLYNMSQSISEKRRENFLALLRKGVGLIALHHSVAAFTEWPEYRKIIGATYFLSFSELDGKTYKASKYKHDVDVKVDIADPNHPITKGMKPFTLHDEVYSEYLVDPEAHVLLTTENPDSARTLCHVKTYEKAKVCYIQPGHGTESFTDANFKLLTTQAIRWTAGRLGE